MFVASPQFFMKHRGLKILAGIFLLVGYSSCEKDFVTPVPDGAAKMVVNCTLDNLRIIKVYLSESYSPTQSPQLNPIFDATVELFKNDSILAVLPFVFTDSAKTFGCYEFPEFPLPGNKYSIKVTHAKYGVVTAEDILPKLIPVSSYLLVHYGDSTNNYRAQFRLQFQDDGAEENFYRINVWQWGEYIQSINYDTGDTAVEFYGYSTRPEIFSPIQDTVRDFGTYILFSDKGFNGQLKEINMEFQVIPLDNVIDGNLVVELTHVSPDNYEYFKTIELYRNSPRGYEAQQVFGNINNGYGIFMGEAINTLWTRVK